MNYKIRVTKRKDGSRYISLDSFVKGGQAFKVEKSTPVVVCASRIDLFMGMLRQMLLEIKEDFFVQLGHVPHVYTHSFENVSLPDFLEIVHDYIKSKL